MRHVLRIVMLASLLLAAVACASGSEAPGHTPEPSATQAVTVQPPPSLTPSPEASASSTAPSATPAPATPTTEAPTPEPAVDRSEPRGFPIDTGTLLGAIVGEVGARSIDWSAGASAAPYSTFSQVREDPVEANAMGWNCRTHFEYEGAPAVDWYLPAGTPVTATMDGLASLYVISLPNAFDYYGADREPYIGDPDRSRAPLSPFPGPGGGKGVYVEVVNSEFVTEYAHLDLTATLGVIPDDRYIPPFSATYDYAAEFGAMRAFNDETLVATWPVSTGERIGYTGDSGYSEAPHLHYTVRRLDGGGLLCPTNEPGFDDSGWLFR